MAGDAEARTSADTLKKQLPADAETAAQRSATSLHAQMTGATQTAASAAPLVAADR